MDNPLTLLAPTAFLNPVIVLANWFQFAPGEQILNPHVESRMLLWCVQGSGRVQVDGVWYDLEPENFLFLPWGREMHYEAAQQGSFRVGGIHIIPDYDPQHPLELGVSHRPGDSLSGSHRRRDQPWAQLEGVRRGSFARAPRLRLLATYIVERFTAENAAESVLRSLALLLLEELLTVFRHTHSVSVPIPARLQKIQDYALSHLEQPLNVEVLSRVAGCSVATTQRLFRQFSDTSASRWVTAQRVEAAKRLLRSTTRPIHSIAAEVGFADPFHFSRLFKRFAGCAPQVFRERKRLL